MAIALHQVWLAHGAQLSAWSGGGFGMFSTTDVWGRRHLHAWVIRPGERRELEIPEALRRLERRALALPDGRRLRALASALAESERDAEPGAGPPTAIALQVFATRYDADSLGPSGEPIAGFELVLDEP